MNEATSNTIVSLCAELAKQQCELTSAQQDLCAIQTGLAKEWKDGTQSGDVVADFGVFMEHHSKVEAERDKARQELAAICAHAVSYCGPEWKVPVPDQHYASLVMSINHLGGIARDFAEVAQHTESLRSQLTTAQAQAERDAATIAELHEENCVLKSQVENHDVTLQQVRISAEARCTATIEKVLVPERLKEVQTALNAYMEKCVALQLQIASLTAELSTAQVKAESPWVPLTGDDIHNACIAIAGRKLYPGECKDIARKLNSKNLPDPSPPETKVGEFEKWASSCGYDITHGQVFGYSDPRTQIAYSAFNAGREQV